MSSVVEVDKNDSQCAAPGEPPPDYDHQDPQGMICDQAQAYSLHSDVTETVEALTKFVRQKPGGTFNPIFRSSSFCHLCSRGAVCLGSFCLGQEPHRYTGACEAGRSPTKAVDNSSSIPGLSGHVHLFHPHFQPLVKCLDGGRNHLAKSTSITINHQT